MFPGYKYHPNLSTRAGFHFFPLITKEEALACALDILFLRRDASGKIIQSGDIDGRIKTVFDALRMPQNDVELKGFSPAADEDPFFVLLQYDSLIRRASDWH